MTAQESEKAGRSYMVYIFPKAYKNGRLVFTTGEFDRVDFYCTGATGTAGVGDVKYYGNPNFPRYYTKYENYQIDYDKLLAIVSEAEKDGRTPLLLAVFYDYTILWDLSLVDWESTAKWVPTNDKGYNYGASKTNTLQAYLCKEDAIMVIPTRHGALN